MFDLYLIKSGALISETAPELLVLKFTLQVPVFILFEVSAKHQLSVFVFPGDPQQVVELSVQPT